MSDDVKELSPRIAVVQDGARLHYALPLALLRAEVLERMFSEGFLKRGWRSDLFTAVGKMLAPARLRGLLDRRCDEIPPECVYTNPWLSYVQRRQRRKFGSDEAFYRWSSDAAGRWISRRGLGRANVLFGFIRNISPGLCRDARSKGIVTVGDQMIAPAAIEAAEAKLQIERWPDWQSSSTPPDYALVEEVERETWNALDLITCASDYVRQGLLQQRVSAEKIKVIPYPIKALDYTVPDRQGRTGPLMVGFVGAVNLRKGTPYFCQVARRLAGANLKFVMVGPVQVNSRMTAEHADCVQFVGRVARSEIVDWLNRFDLFLFPSTCEGSAGAVMEAMAAGLPVVTSPNSGAPITDGREGFLRPYDDIEGMVRCISELAGSAERRRELGRAARELALASNVEQFGRQLINAIQSSLRRRGAMRDAQP